MRKEVRLLMIGLVLNLLCINDLFSQAAVINGFLHPDHVYCSTEGGDSIQGDSPSGKPFYINGIPYTMSTVLVRTANGRAIFYPNRAGVGTHKIVYGDIGSHDVTVYVTVVNMVPVTLAPLPTVCQNADPFSLFNADSSNVSPKIGHFSGPGVNSVTGYFNPLAAGPGVHTITYTGIVGSCSSSATQTITVLAIPNVSLSAFQPVCEGSLPFVLNQGSPAGGTYSGPGVDASGNFNAKATGLGSFPIRYSFSNGTCSSFAERNIIVVQKPLATFSGLGSQYCTSDGDVTLTGNPAAVTGVFSGDGVIDNSNGTGSFSPNIAGLGLHSVNYIYTSPEGCSDTAIQNVQVGTNVELNGLQSKYCINDPEVTITANPTGGTYTVIAGLSPAGPGLAKFNPSAAGSGIHTITYTYTDANGCINVKSIQVRVYDLPVPAIIDLLPSYCANVAPVTIRGNYAPNGSFSGASTVDNNNGTATFNPAGLLPGGPYFITYNYTDGTSQCQATVNGQVMISSIPTGTISGDATICYGNSSTVNVTLTGSGPYDYTYTDGSGFYNVNGAAGPGSTFNVFPTDTTTYRLTTVSDSKGCSNNGTGTVTINVLPEVLIITHPISQKACPGNNIQFRVAAHGANLQYQWEKDGMPIGGAISEVLSLNNVQVTDLGNYHCIVSGSCGPAITSNDASLQLWSPVVLTSGPTDIHECEGENISLQATATGSISGWQWYKDNLQLLDTSNYSGTASNSLIITPAIKANSGVYHMVVTGNCGSVSTIPVNLIIDRAVTIITHPQNLSLCEGLNALFSVTAIGDNLSYQWQKNNFDIPGETQPTLTISDITIADKASYRCRVMNGCGDEDISNAAWLDVTVKPMITLNPVSQNQCENDNASFNVAASGTLLNYQWQKDGMPVNDDAKYSGSTTPALSVYNLQSADEGAFTCIVSNVCGMLSSSQAFLTLDTSLAILSQPVSINNCENSNVAFTVQASGNNITYQWFFNDVPLPAAISPTLVVNNITAANEGQYKCTVSNSCGNSITSLPAFLTINENTTITVQPENSEICSGNNALFQVQAEGDDLVYQWEYNGTAVHDGGNVSGTNTNTLIVDQAVNTNEGVFNCLVRGTCTSERSDPATLLVNDTLVLEKQPENVTLCEGNNAQFSVSASGVEKYQWQKDEVDIIGANSSTYIKTNVAEADSGVYRCVLYSKCDTLVTDGALLTVKVYPAITLQPVAVTVCAGLQAELKADAMGSDLLWTWKKEGNPLTDGNGYSGTATKTLVINPADMLHAGVYSAEIAGYCKSEGSNPVLVSVLTSPVIISQPSPVVACQNQSVSFSVLASNALAYQWQKDNLDLAGKTGPTLSFTNVATPDQGIYRCRITGNCGDIFSEGAQLTINTDIVITDQPDDIALCEENNAVFQIEATGTGIIYQWKHDGLPLSDTGSISGSSTNTLVIQSVNIGDGGLYTCDITGTCSGITSQSAVLDISGKVRITNQPSPVETCKGLSATFEADAAGTGISWQWQKNNLDIPGATNSIFTITSVSLSDSGVYRCLVIGSCGQAFTEGARLTVDIPPSIITEPPTSQRICSGNQMQANAVATGSNLNYQWYFNSEPLINSAEISGANQELLLVNPVSELNEGLYFCRISNSCSDTLSQGMQVWIDNGAVITEQPVNTKACVGEDIVFTVHAVGDNIAYQWQKNNSNIPGAVNQQWSINNVTLNDSGTYRCVVSSACGNILSNAVRLYVSSPLSITTNPPALTTQCEGTILSLGVSADGTLTAYQWKKNGFDLSDGLGISGSKSPNLLISSLNTGDEGMYVCEISSATCHSKVNTTVSTVDVLTKPSVLFHPADYWVIEGGNATFDATAMGDGITWQWYHNGSVLTDGAGISGSQTSSLILSGVTAAHQGSYNAIIKGSCDTTYSNPASLTLLASSIITVQPAGDVKCEGESVTLFIETSGTGNNYQWKKDGNGMGDNGRISGSNTASLTINNLLPSDAGSYNCLVNNTENSIPARLFVNRQTKINLVTGAGSYCEDEAITYHVEATGDSLEYEWYKGISALPDTGSIFGSQGNTMIINPINPDYSGSYTCSVTGACGNAVSDPVIVNVSSPVVITNSLKDTSVCEGQTLNLQVVSSGIITAWQWMKNGIKLTDNARITGSLTQNLQLSEMLKSDEGSYSCVVSGVCDTVYSSFSFVSIKQNAVITNQPQSINRCKGQTATFSVSANLSGLTYQWQKNGTDLIDDASINGSSNYLLEIRNLQLNDSGNYQCIIKSDCNVIASNPVKLHVNDLPVITDQPDNGVICEGGTYNFSVTATGSLLNYQWMKDNTVLAEGGNYTGTKSPVLQITSATTNETAVYHCIITGVCQVIVSDYATLTVNRTTSIITQPLGRNICAGNDMSLAVSAAGTSLTYQWEKDGASVINGGNISGATSPVLQITGLSNADAGIYRCVVQGTCNTLNSQTANIKVIMPPAITLQPANAILCEGNDLLLSVNYTGTDVTYLWKVNSDTLSDLGNISGSAGSQLQIQDILAVNSGNYTCTVENTCGFANSDPALIQVNITANITKQPQNLNICTGKEAIFSLSASGDVKNYKWQRNGSDLADGGNIAGSKTATLVISGSQSSDQGAYRCLIEDGCGNILNSDAATLVVNQSIVIADISSGDTLCEGESVSISLSATGTITGYQWYQNGTPLSDGAGISGSNTSSLIINDLSLAHSGYYTCVINGPCNPLTTASIPLIINKKLQINLQPQNLSRCEGDNAVFRVEAEGDLLKYQWYLNGSSLTDNATINGSTTSLLMLTDLNASETGSYYCKVSSVCDTLNSQTASLTVGVYPDAAGPISGQTAVCQGTEGVNYITNAIPNADYYLWILPPGMMITSGDSTRQIEVTFVENESGGPIYVSGINGCGSGPLSPILNVTANPLPLTYAGESIGICSPEGALHAFDPSPATGIWDVIAGPATIDQPGLPQSVIRNLRNGENKFRWTVTQNGCTLSDTVTITNNQLVISAGNDTSVCDHIYHFNASLPASGSAQWSIIEGSGYNIDRYNPTSLVSGLSRGTNIFKWSVNNYGCVSYDTVIITNNMPDDSEAGNDQFIQSDNTNLNANNPAIGTGNWSLLTGAGSIVNPLAYNTLVTDLGKGKNVFEWIITYKNCISSDTVIIENALMDSTDAGPNKIICSSSMRLSAKNPYPGYGEWSVKRGSATFADNSLYNTIVYNLAQGENVLVWTAYLNGITSDSVIIVNDLPTPANAGVNASICSDSVMLNANVPYIGTGTWTVVSGAGNFDNAAANNTVVRNMANGNNNFKWTITNGTCISSSVVSIINNKPSTAEAGNDATTCEDTVLLNPNVPTFGIGEWSVYTGAAKFAGNNVYDLGLNDNYLIYSIHNAGCYSRDTLLVTSHKPTAVNLGPDKSICQDSVLLTANAPVSGTGIWTLQSGSALFANVNAPVTMIRNIGSGENVLRWTVTYMECSSYDDVLISNDFVKADAGDDQVICSDRTILEGNDPGFNTGTWTIAGGATGATIPDVYSPNSIVENLAQGTNILRWTITKNTCISYDEVNIINNKPTKAFAGENAYLCSSETQLRANPIGIGTGTWSILSGSGIITDIHNETSPVTKLATGVNVLRWTSENAGCISTDEVIIANNNPVNVYAGLNQALCDDSTILYANPPFPGYGNWSVLRGSAAFNDPSLYNSMVSQLGNGDNLLKWTVESTGCSVSDTVTITNNLPTVAVAGSDFPVCNSTGTLSANTPLFGSGQWSIISGGGNIESINNPRTVVSNLELGNNQLRWTIVKENCFSYDDLVIENNSPTIAEAGDDAEVCGETAILYANSPAVGYGYWTVMSGNGDFLDSLSFNTTINGLHFGENTLRWTTKNGSCQTIDEVIIINNLAYVYAGEDQVVYSPEAVLTGNNAPSGSGSWNITAGSGVISDPAAFTTPITSLGAGLNNLEWRITNGSCTAVDGVIINYKVMPRVGFNTNVDEGCPGTTINFINTTQYGTTYRWDMGDGTSTTEINPSHTYNYADNYTVKLIAYGPDNQLVISDTIITIHQKPVAQFEFAPDTGFVGKPIRYYDNSYADPSYYNWNFGDNEVSDDRNPMHKYETSGTYMITLVVSSGYGCSDTAYSEIVIVEDGMVLFPNAFTPSLEGPSGGSYDENDRSNDVFHPYCENVSEYHLEIYSRWGVLLFESDDAQIGWDGYYKGKLLAKDVYVWKVAGKYNSGSEFLKTGTVLLIK